MSRSSRDIKFPSGMMLTVAIDCDWFLLSKVERDIALHFLDDTIAALELATSCVEKIGSNKVATAAAIDDAKTSK